MRNFSLPFFLLISLSIFLLLRLNRHHSFGNSDDCYGYKPHSIALCEADSFLNISPELMPYLNSFKADCKKYGVKCDHAYCLNWMRVGRTGSAQGITCLDDCTIKINEHLQTDTIGMRFVVYHELGHWYGLGHRNGIMKKSYSTREDQEWVHENWTELLDEHFEKLKNAQQ